MQLEEMETQSNNYIRAHINACFEEAGDTEDADARTLLLTEADFYMRELEQRRDRRIARRDFWMEVAVLILIGSELYMSFRAERFQKANFKDEQRAFENLEKSSAATATTLSALSDTTQKMSKAIQEQLGLNYEVMLESHFDKEHKAIDITNVSRTTVYMWGFKQDDERQIVYSKGGSFLPGVPRSIGLERNLKKARTPDNYNAVEYSFGILFKNKPGEEFVGRFMVIVNLTNGGMDAGPISVTRERWSGKEVVLPKSPLIKP